MEGGRKEEEEGIFLDILVKKNNDTIVIFLGFKWAAPIIVRFAHANC